MARPKNSVPTLTLHRATGQARVRLGGQDFYLGRYGSKEAREAYARLLTEINTLGEQVVKASVEAVIEGGGISVAELCLAWKEHAEKTYLKNGRMTSTVATFATPVRVLRELYGLIPAAEFGPLKLEVVRQQLIELTIEKDGERLPANLSRGVINGHIARIRKIFRWGCSRELVPVHVIQALETLEPLRAGRSAAKDRPPIKPVSDSDVDTVLPHLPSIVADMVRLQRLTGMRPSEVCRLRPADVDRRDTEVWQYLPTEHKTLHKDQERIVWLGPKAQDILRKYLLRPATSYCFAPTEAIESVRNARHKARKTPLHYGNAPGTNRRRKPVRVPGDHYDVASYRRCIRRGADKAGVPHWHPNQLRHAAATQIRRVAGLEAAQAALGHAHLDVTQVYAEKQHELARDVAKRIG